MVALCAGHRIVIVNFRNAVYYGTKMRETCSVNNLSGSQAVYLFDPRRNIEIGRAGQTMEQSLLA